MWCCRRVPRNLGPPERRTACPKANSALNITAVRTDKTEAVVLQAHCEKKGFFEKTIMMGDIKDCRKRGRPNMRWNDSIA